MEVGNRSWGRPNPIDFVPLVGLVYRLYWLWMARRGRRTADGDWGAAVRGEAVRAALATVFTVGAAVFVLAGADRAALRPALVFVLVGVFLHRAAAAVGAAGRTGR